MKNRKSESIKFDKEDYEFEDSTAKILNNNHFLNIYNQCPYNRRRFSTKSVHGASVAD